MCSRVELAWADAEKVTEENCRLRPVFPNRGAIHNTQGCRELMRFLIYY